MTKANPNAKLVFFFQISLINYKIFSPKNLSKKLCPIHRYGKRSRCSSLKSQNRLTNRASSHQHMLEALALVPAFRLAMMLALNILDQPL